MSVANENIRLVKAVRDFVVEGFAPRFGELQATFPTNPNWQRLREVGTELWLDTGSLEEAGELWTREFSALTTNNSAVSRISTFGVQAPAAGSEFPRSSRLSNNLLISLCIRATSSNGPNDCDIPFTSFRGAHSAPP